MHPPRVTVRSAMIAVALLASASFAVAMWRRSAEYRARAEEYDRRAFEDSLNARAATSRAFETRPRREPTTAEAAERRYLELRADHEGRLSEKYRRAAEAPWIFLGPDPSFAEPDPNAVPRE